eukprot:TRINITY_DN75878_c0_g1_i1.p1 TRINITY_DN75878_c0_g1~~TRINITY_DN75878_c0_g1_i1.p1  ORF type:complete len:539 (-),score=97.93 TRINITY_DN75878_c0_g1_i1:193-1809(-)
MRSLSSAKPGSVRMTTLEGLQASTQTRLHDICPHIDVGPPHCASTYFPHKAAQPAMSCSSTTPMGCKARAAPTSKLKRRMQPSACQRTPQQQGLRTRCVEAVLYRLLRRLEPEARRQLLQRQLSEAQRLALERWIVSHKQQEDPANALERPGRERTARSSKAKRPAAKLPSGIVRRSSAKRPTYSAHVSIGPFRVYTKTLPSLEKALQMRDALRELREKVATSVAAGADVGLAFRESALATLAPLNAKCAEHGDKDKATEAPGCDFSFAIAVPAKRWLGRELLTPRFALRRSSSASSLDSGLAAYQRLAQLRGLLPCGATNRYTMLRHSRAEVEDVWQRLRVAFLDISEAAGKCRQQAADALRQLEEAHAAKCAAATGTKAARSGEGHHGEAGWCEERRHRSAAEQHPVPPWLHAAKPSEKGASTRSFGARAPATPMHRASSLRSSSRTYFEGRETADLESTKMQPSSHGLLGGLRRTRACSLKDDATPNRASETEQLQSCLAKLLACSGAEDEAVGTPFKRRRRQQRGADTPNLQRQ